MKTTKVHTVILGAGPAGLAAGYTLAKAGAAPIILERDASAGGLMRSIRRGDFILDIGRKELYNRLKRVDALWADLLKGDYRPYPHRGGILFDGKIIEISPAFRGFRRGMPWKLFTACVWGLLESRISHHPPPANLEQYFYQKRGRVLTQVVSQGFQEKLSGKRWAEVKLPGNYRDTTDSSLFTTLKGLAIRTFSRAEVNTFEGVWRHPAKGTGQICDSLAQGISQYGGRFVFNADISEISADGGTIRSILAEAGGDKVLYECENLISTVPVQTLLKLVLGPRFEKLDTSLKSPPSSRRTIVLVYLFLNEEPHFPHAFLHVTCRKTKIGRITNYAAINGDMVPAGKTCLCCEFFCPPDDPLLTLGDNGIAKVALEDCARSNLIDPAKHFDEFVLRLPGADASQNRHNWMTSMRKGLLDELRPFRNLYYAARTDLDIATLAGMEAAEATLSGDRTTFDRHMDPSELEIRSVKKTFEFKSPVEQAL